MTEVSLGRYSMSGYETVFSPANAFEESISGVFGIACSNHRYDYSLIAERDVQAAISSVQAAANDQSVFGLNGVELLDTLLQAVHRSFTQIDIGKHIAGIGDARIADLPETSRNFDFVPKVQLILLQVQRQKLSIACVGNFLVYVVRSSNRILVFGWDWFRSLSIGTDVGFPGPFISGNWSKMPKAHLLETEAEPGDLIVVATSSLAEVIDLARTEQPPNELAQTNTEVFARQIQSTVESIFPKDETLNIYPHEDSVNFIRNWGAAWAVARVEK